MGMSTNTPDENQVQAEFDTLHQFYKKFSILNSQFSILSMGMSGDYKIALKQGSNMIRVGSTIFGKRNFN